jgi:hypothetical protein
LGTAFVAVGSLEALEGQEEEEVVDVAGEQLKFAEVEWN